MPTSTSTSTAIAPPLSPTGPLAPHSDTLALLAPRRLIRALPAGRQPVRSSPRLLSQAAAALPSGPPQKPLATTPRPKRRRARPKGCLNLRPTATAVVSPTPSPTPDRARKLCPNPRDSHLASASPPAGYPQHARARSSPTSSTRPLSSTVGHAHSQRVSTGPSAQAQAQAHVLALAVAHPPLHQLQHHQHQNQHHQNQNHQNQNQHHQPVNHPRRPRNPPLASRPPSPPPPACLPPLLLTQTRSCAFAPLHLLLPTNPAPPLHSNPLAPSLQLLSFPRSPLPPTTVFHFPSPTPFPARHSPPPYPGPLSRSFTSLQIHSPRSPPYPEARLPHSRLPYDPVCCPLWSPSPPVHPSSSTRPKRRLTGQTQYFSRAKKLKRAHLFFRSHLLFFPVAHALRPPITLRPAPSATHMSALAYSPTDSAPNWLTTSAAIEGHASDLGPKEEQWTGTAAGWLGVQPRFSPGSSPLRPSALPSIVPPTRQLRSPHPPASQAAPLKAQLLAVLRMRSNLAPGAASLRFRKWVMYNARVRREQSQMYTQSMMGPMTSAPPPGRTPMRPVTTYTPVVRHSPTGDWTGDEVFDENGDLVCSDEECEPASEGEPEWASAQPGAATETLVVDRARLQRNGTVIRLRLPPAANATGKPTPHPTPPASPVSQESEEGREARREKEGSTGPGKKCSVQVEDQRPPTPPPSPPSDSSN